MFQYISPLADTCQSLSDRISEEKTKQGKKKQSTVEEQAIAVQRDDANEQLFRAIEENKRKAISHEEYLAAKKLHSGTDPTVH